MKDKIINWLRSMQGKSRFDLRYLNTALLMPNNWILSADVYDDNLILYATDGSNMNVEKQINIYSIEYINNCNVDELASAIYNKFDTVTTN